MTEFALSVLLQKFYETRDHHTLSLCCGENYSQNELLNKGLYTSATVFSTLVVLSCIHQVVLDTSYRLICQVCNEFIKDALSQYSILSSEISSL